MFDIGTTAVLLDAAQDLNEALQGGAALSLIPIGIGTIVGIGIVGFFAHHFMKKGDEARRNDPNRFKRLKFQPDSWFLWRCLGQSPLCWWQ